MIHPRGEKKTNGVDPERTSAVKVDIIPKITQKANRSDMLPYSQNALDIIL